MEDVTDETAWRERALRAEKELGDAWEVMGQDRAGATSGRVELGPVGGPYVTVKEDRTLTLPEFLANVTVGLLEQRRYLDGVKAERDRLDREARTVTAERAEAAVRQERERIAEALERRVIDNPTGDVAVALNEAYRRAARIAREETIR